MTDKQRRALEYIQAYVEEYGRSPSYDEIRTYLGIASKSGVHRIVAALERRGLVTRMKGHARSVTLVDPGEHRIRAAVQVLLNTAEVGRGAKFAMVPLKALNDVRAAAEKEAG